jgi:HEAT repeat protein
MQLFRSGSFNEQRDAGAALEKLGAAAKPVLPELIQIAATHYCYRTRTEAQTVILLVGEDALPALIDALDQKGPHQYNVVWAVAHFGPRGRGAVPKLIDLLADPKRDPSERQAAAKALGSMEPGTPRITAALVAALKDGNPSVRFEAVAALGRLRKEASVIVPALASALKDSHLPVRRRVAEALTEFGPLAKVAVPALVEILDRNDEDPELQEAAAEALGRIGPEAKAALPTLRTAVNRPHLRYVAARALTRIEEKK